MVACDADAVGPGAAAPVAAAAAHQLRAVHSGKCIEVPAGGSAGSRPVRQWRCTGQENQWWELHGPPGVGLHFRSVPTRACLVTEDLDWVRERHFCPEHLLDDRGEGRYRLVNAQNGKCVTVLGGSRSDGAPLGERICRDGPGQLFELSLTGSELTYRNTIPAGPPGLEQIRDPQIISVNGTFYMTGTSPPFWEGHNAGVRIRRSTDLVRWTAGPPVVGPGDSGWCKERFWAPEIFPHGSRYYLTVNCRTGAQDPLRSLLAVAEMPTGPYHVLTPDQHFAVGNDAHLFEDDDGRLYVFTSGVTVQEISLDPPSTVGPRHHIVRRGPAGSWDAPGLEGPAVIKQDGTYYLFYSSWGRGYEVGVATSRHILGPWTKQRDNPVYGACYDNRACRRDAGTPFNHVGHGSPFVGPDGRYWLSSHGIGPASFGVPLLVIDPIRFGAAAEVSMTLTWTRQAIRLRWGPGRWTG